MEMSTNLSRRLRDVEGEDGTQRAPCSGLFYELQERQKRGSDVALQEAIEPLHVLLPNNQSISTELESYRAKGRQTLRRFPKFGLTEDHCTSIVLYSTQEADEP